MKANKKAVFMTILAVLDCLCGGVIIWDILDDTKQEKITPIMASANYILVENVFDTSHIKEKKEVEEKKEEIVEPIEPIVYDGMTLKQLSDKLNRSLKSTIAGKGYLIASYSLKRGVDPYVATAIILEETGCEWSCSTLVKKCHNVGGQKGSGCGGYAAFSSLDIGIQKFIDNLANNYYAKGLNTPEKMNAKYASSKSWSSKVNGYVKKIKSR